MSNKNASERTARGSSEGGACTSHRSCDYSPNAVGLVRARCQREGLGPDRVVPFVADITRAEDLGPVPDESRKCYADMGTSVDLVADSAAAAPTPQWTL